MNAYDEVAFCLPTSGFCLQGMLLTLSLKHLANLVNNMICDVGVVWVNVLKCRLPRDVYVFGVGRCVRSIGGTSALFLSLWFLPDVSHALSRSVYCVSTVCVHDVVWSSFSVCLYGFCFLCMCLPRLCSLFLSLHLRLYLSV